MGRRAFLADNAHRVIASTACVAERRVQERVMRARPRKKEAARMAHAARLGTTKIRTKNVMVVDVRERARANTTMAWRA